MSACVTMTLFRSLGAIGLVVVLSACQAATTRPVPLSTVVGATAVPVATPSAIRSISTAILRADARSATAQPPAATTTVVSAPATSIPAHQSTIIPAPAGTAARWHPASAVSIAALPTAPALPAAAPTPFQAESDHGLKPDGPPHDPGPLTWAHPGPYIGAGFHNADVTSFSSSQPLVTTYYFYWHDLTDPTRQARIRSFWTQQPPHPETYSFLNPATHLEQFEDMQAAGIDFVLPVYWGEPGHPGKTFDPTPGHFWSTEGIPPMVQALDQMAAAGHPFKMGMFYDTTILANADLTTPAGKEYFYTNIRDFYSKIPPKYWAAIGGKPIVWLYDTQWVSRFDQSSIDYVTQRFAQDFGGREPYIVRESQWYQSKAVTPRVILHTDNMYGWGVAPSGFNPDPRFGVSEVGPGFNNTGFCRGTAAAGCFDVSRQNGKRYEGEWQQALNAGRKIVALETWNEFSEGSNIAATVEDGRLYINLTRKYADMFHAQR